MKSVLLKTRKEKDLTSLSGRIWLGFATIATAFVLTLFIVLAVCAFFGKFSFAHIKSMLMVAAVLAVFVVIPANVFIHKVGGALGTFFSGSWARGGFSVRERLKGELDKARHFKTQKEFSKALQLVNSVLEKDPEFPDALFLKAQILYEGFGNSGAAKGYLEKVSEFTSPDELIHRWARSYSEDLDKRVTADADTERGLAT